MATRTREDRRLRKLGSICLALPEAERTLCGMHADFRVRGRIFAYYLRNHHGDGITAACFKTGFGEHIERVKQNPARFYLPRYIGLRGWFGLRLDRGTIDWEEIAAMAALSYDLVAPRALRKPVDPLSFVPRRPPASRPVSFPTESQSRPSNTVVGSSLRRGSPPVILSAADFRQATRAARAESAVAPQPPRAARLSGAAAQLQTSSLRSRR